MTLDSDRDIDLLETVKRAAAFYAVNSMSAEALDGMSNRQVAC